MNISKLGLPGKALMVGLILVFAAFNACPDSFAQVGAPPAGIPAAEVIKEEVKESLPGPGNVSVNFKNVDILTILHYLSEVSGVDIVPSPGVEAEVTMRLRDKPWETALDIVTRNYGYVHSREGDIIRVIPKEQLQTEELVTEVIPLDHIIRDIELIRREDTDGDEVGIRTTEESLQQLLGAINSMLDAGRGETATYVSGANAIVVTAVPARINEVKEMIAKIDTKTPQIMLDAKIIEITLTDDERFGIDWNTVISAAGARRPITLPFTNTGVLGFLPGEQARFYPTNVANQSVANFPPAYWEFGIDVTAAPTANSIFSFGTLDFSTFTATLRLLDQRGDTEILSSPRITTLNNQKATIKVVEKIMLQKTQETTQTADIITVEFEDEDEAREVGVKLTIMPHVNTKGDIIVNLMPEVSTSAGFTQLEVTGTETNAISLTFNSREANTRVRVKDGDTIFIGGLIRENVSKTDNKFPILGDLFGGIPVVGNLFRYEAETVTKTEIVFFVTVHLVKDSMDSIVDSRTVPQYNKYVPVTEEGSAEGEESAQRAAEEKKTYKPFLDFRKKK